LLLTPLVLLKRPPPHSHHGHRPRPTWEWRCRRVRSAPPADTSTGYLPSAALTRGRWWLGKDVGTPIIHFEPPQGVAFFGPVISRLPGEAEAIELWDHVVGLARFPGFAEMKRSLRELPQLRRLGVAHDEVGVR